MYRRTWVEDNFTPPENYELDARDPPAGLGTLPGTLREALPVSLPTRGSRTGPCPEGGIFNQRPSLD